MIFHLKPLKKVASGNHIHLGSFVITDSAAVVVTAQHWAVICHHPDCHGVGYHVQFDVVMVPVLPFIVGPGVNMTVDQDALLVSERPLIIAHEPHHGRI